MLKIEKGDLNEIIQCIQKYPKYINLKNKSGNSAITTAIRLNDLSILKILLDNKADVNIQTKSSQTPLYLATFNNQIEVVSILLQYNANVNISDQRGWSPLMIAANKGFIDIIYLLLNSLKCDLFQKNQRGETVFELAKNKEVLNIIVDNCGFKVSEIEDQLGNSIMCGIRTKLNCNNNSLQNAQKTLFDAGSFYQKEVKRVQSTFKSICEKNHSQLNKLRNDLASIQGEVIQKKSYQKGKLLQENKEILNQQDNNYSSKYQNQSVNSYQSNQANNNIPYVTQFNYDSQNYYSQNSNQAKIEIQNESLIFSKANSNNITPSKGKQLSINSNSKSQIKKYSGGEDQSTQIISSNSQNRNNLPPSSQTQKNAVSHYGSNQSNNFNINSSQKKSSNKISSFIVTDDIPDSSSTKSNKKNFGNSNGGRLEQSMDEYSQSNNDQQITETSKFKELEEDFLKKSSSELIEQFIRQLMSQIKFLIPNIPTESYTKYESSITYFIEQLINNPNLSHIEKILVLMQFQSQILIEIMQNQQKNHQQKTIPQTTNSSFQNINQISNTQSSDEQKYLTTSGDATEDNIKKVDFNINLKQIPQISTVQQKKQQVLLDMINQESSPSLNENSNNYQINVKQPQQQQAIKEKYYQMAKNKHFQMDGIIEQPTLEMIETPSQNQSQSKKMQFPNKDSYQQYIHENEVSKRTEDSASKNEEPSIPTISPPRNISEDEDILSTLKDSSKSDFCQSQTKQSNQNFKLNFSDKQNRKQLIQQDKNSAMFQILGNQKSEQNQYLLQQDNHDYQISEKFSITDNFLNFNDNAISSADIFHHAEYNTIESFNTNPNLLTSDQNKETKSFIDDTRHGFVVEYKISNEKQNQFDEDDMILDQNLQRDEYDEIADQLSQTNLNKNLFDQVHVFNGNKCQVVQSGQTSKAQSEIDYEISPTNSSRVNQGVQQIFSQRNNQKNENQNQEGYLYNIQQFDYNQYDYTSDEDSNEHQNIQYISQAQNSERQSKNKLHTSNDTILNQGKKQEQASKKTHSDNQNQFENDQINEQTDNQTLNSNFCGEDLKQNDQNNIASHSKQQVNMHQRNIQKLQKMNEALNEKLNQIQQNRVNLQLKMKNKI